MFHSKSPRATRPSPPLPLVHFPSHTLEDHSPLLPGSLFRLVPVPGSSYSWPSLLTSTFMSRWVHLTFPLPPPTTPSFSQVLHFPLSSYSVARFKIGSPPLCSKQNKNSQYSVSPVILCFFSLILAAVFVCFKHIHANIHTYTTYIHAYSFFFFNSSSQYRVPLGTSQCKFCEGGQLSHSWYLGWFLGHVW